MNAIQQRLSRIFSQRAQNWARRRQGADPLNCQLASRRIYILPTRPGMIFAVIVFTILLGSMNYSNNMGFALTFLLTAIGIISIHHCHRNIADVIVSFAGSQPAFAGEHVTFNFVVENAHPFTRHQLRFGLNHRQDICDLLVKGQRQQIAVRVRADHRGRLELPRLLMSTRYPLGLFRAWAWIYMDVSEIVYPQPASAASLLDTTHGGQAIAGSRLPGDDDFSGLRDYRLGDPPKRIAWKILARSGDMHITEYQGGTNDLIWIDWHDYPRGDTEQRLSTLARLIIDTEASGSTWGLRLPGLSIGPAKGAAHQHQCLTALALFESGDMPEVNDALAA